MGLFSLIIDKRSSLVDGIIYPKFLFLFFFFSFFFLGVMGMVMGLVNIGTLPPSLFLCIGTV